jgi:hypothetical protein
MKLTIKKLNLLIESYLFEKEKDKNTEALISDTKPFVIEIDSEKHEVQFVNVNGELQYKVDGEILSNKSVQDFMTLAGIGLLGEDDHDHNTFEKIVKLDKKLENYSLDRIKDIIKQKKETERIGFRVQDIRKALGL